MSDSDDRSQEFRVGMLAIVALVATVFMVFRFGEIGNRFKSGTRITVVLPSANGVHPDTPVRMSGIRIGHVESMMLIAEGRGVAVQVVIQKDYRFRSDSTAVVTRSLLGDGAIEIIPGTSGGPIASGGRIPGRASGDPAEMVARVEQQLSATLSSFEKTGNEWGRLAGNVNRLLEASGPDGVTTLQRSAMALEQFTRTMKATETTLSAAGDLISDPRYQQQLQQTMAALPELLNETRTTLKTVHGVVRQMETTMANVNTATSPLAQQGEEIVSRLNRSLGNVETMTGELAVIAQLANQQDGTFRKLLTDPSVYRNLNTAVTSLAALLGNLGPVVADIQVFSDKIARHPEILGVRGIVKGSNGVKQAEVIPAAFEK